MAERKQLSTKTRFDIFKRDSFTCQYCGATPPGVILHVDHVLAVAQGGQNEIENLVTACSECNLGKGARLLSTTPQSLQDMAAETVEREEQLKAYQKLLKSKARRTKAEIEKVCEIYSNFVPGYTLNDKARVSVKQFIERLGVYPCIEAMEISCNRWAHQDYKIFRYFCGICWSKIREKNDGQG